MSASARIEIGFAILTALLAIEIGFAILTALLASFVIGRDTAKPIIIHDANPSIQIIRPEYHFHPFPHSERS